MHLTRVTIASIASIAAITLTVPISAANFAFIPLGSAVSEVNDVSADGSVIVGTAKGSPIEAFRWRLGEELVGLGNELSVRGTIASAISGDGTAVSGSILGGSTSRSAFLWTEPSGMQPIQGGNGITIGPATALSFDGKVAIGQMAIANVSNGFAYRWTEATGAVNLGDLPGGNVDSWATDVSADGAIVVGNSGVDSGYAPFRWTAEEGMVELPGFTPGEPAGSALAISPDGSAIAGYSFRRTPNSRTQEAAIWRGNDVSLLGHLAGGRFTSAYGISAGGNVVVGSGIDSDGFGAAFRWTEQSGVKSVAKLLEMGGIDMTGWRLLLATSVSSDGSVIVGQAMNPSGLSEDFVAKIPAVFVPEPDSMAIMVSAAYSLIFFKRRVPLAS